ncbi:MAG: cobalamin B12-binding domain-containing protein [Pseudomonadota bacterium]
MSILFDISRPVRDTSSAGVNAHRESQTNGPVPEALTRRIEEMTKGPTEGRSSDARGADQTTGSTTHEGPRAKSAVEAFASQVLTLVAANAQAPAPTPREDLIEALMAAALTMENAAQERIYALFSNAGISNADVVDLYLPEVARRLGAAWCEDEMSFADVTIGSSRLQACIRDLRAPQVTDSTAAHVLIVVPKDAYHTLGASVVADQLRRLGVAPKMALGLSLVELAELLESHDFNAVMISAAASERLEKLRDLVNCVKTASHADVPVIVGGTVTDKDTDIRTLTGADYVSNNPEEALRACGLTIPMLAVEPPGYRG